ncbi:MAG: hypothetical protein AAGF91_06530 [Actinomycetota bacterium]
MDQPDLDARLWIPIGLPGFSGDDKQRRRDLLDDRFGDDGWRWRWVVRGHLVDLDTAIAEYEESYRVHLHRHPEIVDWLTTRCGNVYDHSVDNVFDDEYVQPGPAANHYQDISVRRVIAEMTDDDAGGWGETVDLVDLGTGETHRVPRARGFRGDGLAQIRDAHSPAYFLNPALVPVHDPTLISTVPSRNEWYHQEGVGHLSVEAFWQMSKVVEVRFDRFRALGPLRDAPLDLA